MIFEKDAFEVPECEIYWAYYHVCACFDESNLVFWTVSDRDYARNAKILLGVSSDGDVHPVIICRRE